MTKKTVFCAAMSALAIIFGYIESLLIPPLPIPGLKLGVANIAVLLCVYNSDKKAAWLVCLIKAFVSNLLFGSVTMLIYSFFGSVFSILAMLFAKKLRLHIITASILGGIFHNLGQLLCAALLLKNINIFYYMPVLIIGGIAVSVLTGICAAAISRRLSRFFK